MKKQILLTLVTVLSAAFGLKAQLMFVNDGAEVMIQSGAVLTIEGDFENKNSGTVNNDGRIVLHGDFINSATFDGTDPNTVAFVGPTNSEVTSGGAIFDTVEVAKDADQMVVLMDDMTISGAGAVTYATDDSYLSIGDNNLIMQDGAVFQNADNNNFVVTNGSGYLRFEDIGASETADYPVGYDKDTYNPVTLASTGSNTNDNYDVRVLENVMADGLTGDVLTEGVVDASWEINEGTDGGSDVDVTVQWDGTDELVNFDNMSNAISKHDGTAWDLLYGDLGAASGADPYTRTRTGVDDFSVFAVGGQEIAHSVDLHIVALLGGTYTNGTGLMRDDLRSLSLIPTIEPYTADGYSHEGFGGDEMVDASVFDPAADTDDNIVDWVVVEIRDGVVTDSVIASKAALLQRDGDIVDLDGASDLKIPGVADGDYIVAIKHRNHLGVRTPGTLALSASTPAAHDFTTGQSQAFIDPGIDGSAANPTSPMQAQFDGKTTLYGGDLDHDGRVSYNVFPTDPFQVLLALGFATNNTIPGTYNTVDADMNGTVSYNVFPTDPFVILQAVGFATNSVMFVHD